MQGDFLAIDVETANRYQRGSICSFAVIHCHDGIHETVFSELLNPQIEIDPCFTHIHGITNSMVADKPSFGDIWPIVAPLLQKYPVVAHNAAFDISCLEQAQDNFSFSPIDISYMCSLQASRIVYYHKFSSYSLDSLCAHFNIPLEHHNAASDAVACAKLVETMAAERNAKNLDEFAQRCGLVLKSSLNNGYVPVTQVPIQYVFCAPEFESAVCETLSGKTVVFTGAFANMDRSEAEHAAQGFGANIGKNVTRKTDILVVGIQDLVKTKGYEKSSKHRKAEELISEGRDILIIDESEFMRLINEG